MAQSQKRRPGIKHSLRIYQRQYETLIWPAFLLAIASYILWWISFDYPLPLAGRSLILVISGAAWILYLLCLIAPSFCYVQCHADFVVVSAIYPLAISYARIGNAVPVDFRSRYPFNQMSWGEQNLMEPLFKEQNTGQLTVVAMHLREYPLHMRWLRLWFNKFMFFPAKDGPGFLFIVRDWMALSNELEDFRTSWRAGRSKKKTTSSIASKILSSKGGRR
jgi:hypothetical protein